MGIQVNVDEEQIQLLEKYCKYTPSEVPILIGRIAREFYSSAWKHMIKSEGLMQNMSKNIPKIDDRKIQGISIDKKIADTYHNSVKLMNDRLESKYHFNPDHLLTWLVSMFIRRFEIEKRAKQYKEHKVKI